MALVAACSTTTHVDGSPEAGTEPDGASSSGSSGSSTSKDDAGESPDGETTAEASTGSDSGPSLDGGTGGDVNVPGKPTCGMSVTPQTGGPSDSYYGEIVTTNATTCTANVDGTFVLSIPCNGQTSWPGSTFGAGVHTAVVTVAGPAGATQCSTSWTVLESGVPTCSVTVTPHEGKVSDSYSGQLTSTGATSCVFRVDNGTQTSIPCAETLPFPGSTYGPGTHVVVVTASGEGASSCTATWIEDP